MQLFMQSLFQEFGKIDNIVGIGTGNKFVRGEDTGQPAIIVLVKKKMPKTDLQRTAIIPRKIENMPTDIIEVGDIRLLTGRTTTVRPAQPGISVGHYKVSAGTFGAVVKDRNTGELLILSNNHVLANATDGFDGRASIGDPILQPGIYDGADPKLSVIGTLDRFIPIIRETSAPRCKIANLFGTVLNKCISLFYPKYRVQVLRQNEKYNLVDCALAKPTDETLIIPEIYELGSISGIKEPKVGMAVKKSGRSTGVTHSIILATDVTLKVNLDEKQYGIFTDQVITGPMSIPGDSGSLILTEDNHAVGLLFAGSEKVTMFNRLDNVLDALNIIM